MQSSSNASSAVAAPAVPWTRRVAVYGRLPVAMRWGLLLALLLGVWQAYIELKNPNPLQFVTPADTARAFWDGWSDGSLWSATRTTLRILGIGMAIGTAVALLLTAFATFTRVGDDLLGLLTAMINPLPGVAILPLALLWFGLNESAIIFVIANAVTWPIAINLSTGFKTVNPTIVAVARNVGVKGVRLVTDVLAPAALPHAVSGLRTAWAFGWRTIVAAELVFGVSGDKGGLGWLLNDARFNLETERVFAGLVTIMLIGIALDVVFLLVERWTVVRWGMKSTAQRSSLRPAE